MCEVKSTFRRLGMEVQFDKTGRRVKKDGVWRDITHEYTMVDHGDDVKYCDGDIIEVWLPSLSVFKSGGDTSMLTKHPEDDDHPHEERAIEVSSGRGKYIRKFVIESIFITRQRKCIEGFFWEEGSDSFVISNTEKIACILARQTVQKINHSRSHEIVGLMKKQREAMDNTVREEEVAAAKMEALSNARKKKAKEIDFSQPSAWGTGPRQNKRKKSNRVESDSSEDSQKRSRPKKRQQRDADPEMPVSWLQAIRVRMFGSLTSGFDVCCGKRIGHE
eukprot:TRINITY_DN30750_c0_g1_i1.p1 TRINITY_DN30750_c0_g1~~TRINITY_DN30750_c0_g1_i1.p1  ORF type:complete len:276 (+),score=42.34 TRINITY_DN30750_c0_g1_i1:45-872(+)